METQEVASILFSSASIAASILGFGAVASVFHPYGADKVRWQPDGRFWSMVSVSLATLFLSLIPIPILYMNIGVEKTWLLGGICQASAAVILIALSCHFYPKNHAVGKPPNNLLFALLIIALGMLALCGILNIGIVGTPGIAPYLIGIVVMLMTSGWLFTRLMYVWLT